MRLTFSGSDPQTYLLLTRDVSVSVGIIDCIRSVIAAEGVPVQIAHLEAPSVGPSLVVGYFCMFYVASPSKPKGFLDIFGDSVTDFPQHIYPLRHVAKDMCPVTLAITSSHIYLLHENHTAWPSNDRNPASRWTKTIKFYEVHELVHVEMVSERGANIGAHAMSLDFAIDNWMLVSQHGTNNSAIYRALAAVWGKNTKIQLPRVEMKSAVRSAMFDNIDAGRREASVTALTSPFRKAFGSK